jgi:hypothetical protein
MAGAAALEVLGEAAAKRIAQRGAGELFDRALDR